MKARKSGRRRLKGLSRTAESAVLKREVFGRLKLDKWLKILKELAGYDEAGDFLRARCKKRAVTFGVALVPLLFFLFMWGGDKEFWVPGAVLGTGVLIAGGLLVYCLIRNRRLKDLDLSNDFRTVLVPFLTAIREDVPSKDKIKLKLDLTGPSKAKVIRKLEPVQRGGKKVQETVYSDRWCNMEAPLAAGNRITLDILNIYRRYKISGSNPGGKHKWKTKWKKLVVVRASMSSVAGRFGFDPVIVQQKSKEYGLKLKKGFEGETVAVKMKKKFKSAGPTPPSDSIHPKEILGMFLRLESLIRPIPTGSLKA